MSIFDQILSNFDKHDKAQLLANFKKQMQVGFRASPHASDCAMRTDDDDDDDDDEGSEQP